MNEEQGNAIITAMLKRAAVRTFPQKPPPVSFGEKRGEAKTYYVFYWKQTPIGYADDAPEYYEVTVVIRVYTPPTADTSQIIKDIRAEMKTSDFGEPVIAYSADANGKVIELESKYLQMIPAEED